MACETILPRTQMCVVSTNWPLQLDLLRRHLKLDELEAVSSADATPVQIVCIEALLTSW